MALVAAMPPGTVTVSDVSVAAVTVADVPPEPPNLTVFEAGVAMKFVPVTTTDEPRLPLVGAKDVMVGHGRLGDAGEDQRCGQRQQRHSGFPQL